MNMKTCKLLFQGDSITDADRERDSSIELSVSYGLDSADEEERIEDYRAVRGLKE